MRSGTQENKSGKMRHKGTEGRQPQETPDRRSVNKHKTYFTHETKGQNTETKINNNRRHEYNRTQAIN